tara:strand:- start:60927 stop:62921 length:1995 start_codon:yes stop_codon:yes gene_type:complete
MSKNMPSDSSMESNSKAFMNKKQVISGVVFLMFGFGVTQFVPSVEIAWVSAILILTIYLFAFEIVEVDVAAISIMVLLGLTGLFAPLIGLDQALIATEDLFDGFASNAVISIIAVMIIGAGLDKTGVMTKVAASILKIGGKTEARIIPIISATVAFISSFMQNVGAAALFLPVVARISARSGLPMSRLLMPMGFTAILGGTVTLVGSSPLILLNDLMLTSNVALPENQQMEAWSLFSVTPVGIALVATGIIYFVVAGKFVLPANKADGLADSQDPMNHLKQVYDVNYNLSEVIVPLNSLLVGMSLDDVETDNKVRIIASRLPNQGSSNISESIARDFLIGAEMSLGIVADPVDLDIFVEKFKLDKLDKLDKFSEELSDINVGFAEIVIPPGSKFIGKSARDLWMRKVFGIAMIGFHRNGKTMREGDDIRNIQFQAGDTIVCHTYWKNLERIEKNKNFVVVTTEYPRAEEERPQKVKWAALFFVVALSMILFTDVLLSVALLTGAIGMILSGVLKIDEAYEAVSWKTVFLLASLIPLGLAVETTGTAKWIAEEVVLLVGGADQWMIQAAIAILATFFTLVMSNVGATVLLVPLAVNIAIQVGADPAVYALTVAIATSNSFLIPTHQVNALIMGPAGYRVPDFMRAGGIMTILFLIVMIVTMNLVF